MRLILLILISKFFIQQCFCADRKNPWQFYKLGILPEDHEHYHLDHHHNHAHSHTTHKNNVHHVSEENDHHNHDHDYDHAHYINGRWYYHHGAHKAPPGYPSSDFVRYFAKYTSSGGTPRRAPHNYYYDKHGELHHFDIEPEYAEPKSVRAAHLRRLDLSKPLYKVDKYEHHRNFVAAGGTYLYRTDTGKVPSPSGEGPHHGFYYGPSSGKPKLYVGNRPFYY